MNAHLWCKYMKLRELKGAARIYSEKINIEYLGNFSFGFSRRCVWLPFVDYITSFPSKISSIKHGATGVARGGGSGPGSPS